MRNAHTNFLRWSSRQGLVVQPSSVKIESNYRILLFFVTSCSWIYVSRHNTFVLEYSPRSRPPRPVIALSLLTTIKECPEEWRQFSYQIVPKSGKYHLESLTCQVLIENLLCKKSLMTRLVFSPIRWYIRHQGCNPIPCSDCWIEQWLPRQIAVGVTYG